MRDQIDKDFSNQGIYESDNHSLQDVLIFKNLVAHTTYSPGVALWIKKCQFSESVKKGKFVTIFFFSHNVE